LTQFCKRHATPRNIYIAASDNGVPFGQNALTREVVAKVGDKEWAALTKHAVHPKRSFILCMIVLMAAVDFWKRARKTNEIYSAIGADNPIRSMNSDVVISET
jgi:hypothetical protein